MGLFADRYSNKTIIAIGAPIYILCLIAWCFVERIYTRFWPNPWCCWRLSIC